MTVKVLICDPIHEDGIKRIESAGLAVDYRPEITQDELSHMIGEYEALIVRSRTKLGKNLLKKAKKLKLIVRAGVGLDNIDVDTARKLGIKVVNTPAALTNAVAELALGLIICLARRINFCDLEMKKGKWVKKKAIGMEISGKILGIVGFGRIGRCLAEKALALGMKVIAYDIIEIPDRYLRMGVISAKKIDDVFKNADFISLHVPLTKETYHLVGEELLSKMKKTAFLINTSRGAVVDSKALKKFLEEGKIAGAALDVFEVEPPGKDELIMMNNVVATPHIGGQTVEAQRKAALMAADEIINFFKGERLFSR
ncbi:3-phosphoglycerate dehydrogenase [Candidatus Geothermarchaeota archaeon]|nr:MAG: 3-phosphoglycerate dehydrogenase [Candidatus Geothermarchaeota archaeon]